VGDGDDVAEESVTKLEMDPDKIATPVGTVAIFEMTSFSSLRSSTWELHQLLPVILRLIYN
jgi:hypothetical protein